MKNLKKFDSFINEANTSDDHGWGAVGPNWLHNYIMSENGHGVYANGKYLTIALDTLDVVAIFFVHENAIRWNWTWGSDQGDVVSMVEREIEMKETLGLGITGDTPAEFVKNVIAKIDEIEAQRAKENK